jgi:hypothetical protein
VTQDTVTILPGSRFRAAMTLAIIADAYRKSKQIMVSTEESRQQHPTLKDPQHS